jgi:hypothetical protein
MVVSTAARMLSALTPNDASTRPPDTSSNRSIGTYDRMRALSFSRPPPAGSATSPPMSFPPSVNARRGALVANVRPALSAAWNRSRVSGPWSRA